jgi:type I restriction enzyme R subunit
MAEQNEVDKFEKMDLLSNTDVNGGDRNLEKRFKDTENPFRLAIVLCHVDHRFDAQCVSTFI